MEESKQALGLYLLVCGAAPAKTVIEKYALGDAWRYIAASAETIRPEAYIASQIACIKERAETVTNTANPVIQSLATIQAYSLGDALYTTFPNLRELYATAVQQTVRPLFLQKK